MLYQSAWVRFPAQVSDSMSLTIFSWGDNDWVTESLPYVWESWVSYQLLDLVQSSPGHCSPLTFGEWTNRWGLRAQFPFMLVSDKKYRKMLGYCFSNERTTPRILVKRAGYSNEPTLTASSCTHWDAVWGQLGGDRQACLIVKMCLNGNQQDTGL